MDNLYIESHNAFYRVVVFLKALFAVVEISEEHRPIQIERCGLVIKA
jgi:hypothetical protein